MDRFIALLGFVGLFIYSLPTTTYSVATNKLNDLVVTRYWSHTDSDGCDYDCRVSGMRSGWIGENLYFGPCDIQNAFRLWGESPTHKEILESEYDDLVILGKRVGNECFIIYEVSR